MVPDELSQRVRDVIMNRFAEKNGKASKEKGLRRGRVG